MSATSGAADEWMLDKPITVGPARLRGRVFVPAHQPGIAEHGVPSKRYVAYQRERARAGAAMQITGATPVTPSAVWSEDCLVNVDDSIIPGYQRLSKAVQDEGGVMLAQLAHPGPTEEAGRDVIGPSRLFSRVTQQFVRPATLEELAEVVDQFAAAARRCREGGLNGVEVSLAHGLLLAAFLSPLTNHRQDEFGGDLTHRLAFPLQVIRAVRQACGPDMIVGTRLVADDMVSGGITAPEAARIAQSLQADVDYINVIAGNNNWLEARFRHWPSTPAPFGLFRQLAATVKESVTIPVCVAGRVTTPQLANDILLAGDADLVGMVRAHIADPQLLTKARAGRSEDIRPCVGANLCVTATLAGRPIECLVNPDPTGDQPPRSKTRDGQRAVVVGGGPGGMEAARQLHLQGYAVTLFEQHDHLGGQMAAWANAPSRHEIRRALQWWRRQLDRHEVELRLSTEATPGDVVALEPDAVVLATGASPTEFAPVAGAETIRSLDPIAALNATASRDVVVADEIGLLDAMYIAEHFADAGSGSTTLVTERLHVGDGEGWVTLLPMIRSLAERGVKIVERAAPERVTNGLLSLRGTFGESHDSIPVDTLVTYSGRQSHNPLEGPLMAAGLRPLVIGDAVRPRRVLEAIREASQAYTEPFVEAG